MAAEYARQVLAKCQDLISRVQEALCGLMILLERSRPSEGSDVVPANVPLLHEIGIYAAHTVGQGQGVLDRKKTVQCPLPLSSWPICRDPNSLENQKSPRSSGAQAFPVLGGAY